MKAAALSTMSLIVVCGIMMWLGWVVKWHRRKVGRVMEKLAYGAGGIMLGLAAILIVVAFVIIAQI